MNSDFQGLATFDMSSDLNSCAESGGASVHSPYSFDGLLPPSGSSTINTDDHHQQAATPICVDSAPSSPLPMTSNRNRNLTQEDIHERPLSSCCPLDIPFSDPLGPVSLARSVDHLRRLSSPDDRGHALQCLHTPSRPLSALLSQALSHTHDPQPGPTCAPAGSEVPLSSPENLHSMQSASTGLPVSPRPAQPEQSSSPIILPQYPHTAYPTDTCDEVVLVVRREPQVDTHTQNFLQPLTKPFGPRDFDASSSPVMTTADSTTLGGGPPISAHAPNDSPRTSLRGQHGMSTSQVQRVYDPTFCEGSTNWSPIDQNAGWVSPQCLEGYTLYLGLVPAPECDCPYTLEDTGEGSDDIAIPPDTEEDL